MKSVLLLCLILVAVQGAPTENDESGDEEIDKKFTYYDCLLEVQDKSRSCKAYIPVYHWNHETQQCEEAVYGGCNATRNNFRTLKECQEVAKDFCGGRIEP